MVRPLLGHFAHQRIELRVGDLTGVHNDTPDDLFPKCAGEVCVSEIFSVRISSCMEMPVNSNCAWNPTQNFAWLIAGGHHSMTRRFGV